MAKMLSIQVARRFIGASPMLFARKVMRTETALSGVSCYDEATNIGQTR